ncbi:MAG: AhpC/TSA family protein [Chitinophagaceae bacterium]|nr:MAG: AhpC/TSA family protein [Chitinophagaceae bacterium]
MMKQFLAATLLFCSQILLAQEPVTLKGSVTNMDGHSLAVIYYSPLKKTRDTVQLTNDQFELKLKIKDLQEIVIYPYNYYKYAVPTKDPNKYFLQPMLDIFVAPGDVITINGDAKNLWEAKVSGGAYHKEWEQLRSVTMPLETENYSLLAKQYSKEGLADSIAFNKYRAERGVVKDKNKLQVINFFKKNTGSIYAMYKFSENLKALKPAEIESLFAAYTPELQESVFGEKITLYLDKAKALAVGSKMIDFSATTLKGEAFDSKNLRGKYVLIDFWGSWCGPCRKSNPHLKELYKKYNTKGFEIVGIAQEMIPNVEKAKAALTKAVVKDGLPWVQILNNEMKDDLDLVKTYNVKGFPTKILVDKEGKMIWRGSGLDSPELDEKLEQIFGK